MKETAIHLRALEPEDLDMLYQIENNRELWSVGVTNVPYSRYILQEYIATQKGDIYADRQVRLMIEDSEGECVGIADIINFEPQHMRAEVGIVVIDGKRRQGYALEALRQLQAYAFSTLHLHQLYAYVDVDNEASLMLFKKAGYSRQSVLGDWLYDGRNYHDVVLMQLFL